MKIKVCGMKYATNINDLNTLVPDFMGFIFYPKSKRFIGVDFMISDTENLNPKTSKVAVFVNALPHEVIEFAGIYGMRTVQLHGDESVEVCAEIKSKGFKIIKAFGVDEKFDFTILEKYKEVVDYFLFDTKTSEFGGSGKKFDWQILDNYLLNIPFLLSGGLSLDNLKEVKELKHKQLFAVDLNSKFEIEPGLKNIEMLDKAFEMIRE